VTGVPKGSDADVAAVTEANLALYTAQEQGDLDALTDVWVSGADADDVHGAVCVHPGWPILRGRASVLRSYALIMAHTDYIQFFLTDVEVEVLGDVALVTCTENILSSGDVETEGELGPLVGGRAVATNLFRRTGEGWRLWSHHGSPVLTSGGEDDGDAEEGDGEG
jgi:ketosteroid isomerase-like protein